MGSTRKSKLLCILGPTGTDMSLTRAGSKSTHMTRLESCRERIMFWGGMLQADDDNVDDLKFGVYTRN